MAGTKHETKAKSDTRSETRSGAKTGDTANIQLLRAVRHDGTLHFAGETLSVSRADADRLERLEAALIIDERP